MGRSPRTEQGESAEAVRLVVWDLDETFWKGTLTEGGILEYVQTNHDIVIELAHRGILSSVCSKNNFDDVIRILSEKCILDYIIFPSISWDAKGPRLAALVEAAQLRPATVMFIDDNPNNRAEAQEAVAGLQVADETFIAELLNDPRFTGNHDPKLNRLAQYKLLETRKRDEVAVAGGNAAFLRGCDIRVQLEYDLDNHIDRAIELINRTNQLNYTKSRLPEDPRTARAMLTEQLRRPNHQAGLVRVVDKYGDYGFVGFFMLRFGRKNPAPNMSAQTLVHYCFSCRTLGMLVEGWLYHLLRRPEIEVVGDVLTDLSQPRSIDWLRLAPSVVDGSPAAITIAPELRIIGGCEAHAMAHYLSAYSRSVKVTGNFTAGKLLVRVNSAELLLSVSDHAGPLLDQELATVGIPAALMGTECFTEVAAGTIFIFSGAYDAQASQPRYRHRRHGWTIRCEINGLAYNFVDIAEKELLALIDTNIPQSKRDEVVSISRHIRENYDAVKGPGSAGLSAMMENLLARVPPGCKLILLLDDPRERHRDGDIRTANWIARYNEQMRTIASRHPFVAALSFSDVITSEEQILPRGSHYDRMVYWRMSEKIVEAAQGAPAKDSRCAG